MLRTVEEEMVRLNSKVKPAYQRLNRFHTISLTPATVQMFVACIFLVVALIRNTNYDTPTMFLGKPANQKEVLGLGIEHSTYLI